MNVYLIEARPVAKATGNVVVLRYSSSSLWTKADGLDWLPRLAVPFSRAFQAFDGAFSDQPRTYGSFEVRMSTGDLVSPVVAMAWAGRQVRVWRGPPGTPTNDMELVFSGEAEGITATKQGYQVALRGPGYPLTQNMMQTYDGSGGTEGAGSLANTIKPLVLGAPLNVEPVYLDRPRGIFQYHGYGHATLPGVYDAGSQLAWSGNNYATYQELFDNEPAPGYYSTCDNLGCARHGGAPIDVLTCDPVASATASGRISSILTWLANSAGVPVDADTMAWFEANMPHPQDNYVTDQTSYEAVMRDMILKLGGYLDWTADGRLTAGLVRRGAVPAVVLDRRNIGPTPTVQLTQPPLFRRRMGYRRAWSVQTYSQVRTPREVNPRGTYLSTNVYSYYDLVNFGLNSWLHIGFDPTQGVAPAEGPVWTLFGPGATKTSELTDDAGLGLTALWPSVSGTGKPTDYADVTAVNTAASITGQGAYATQNQVAYGSTLLTGFGALSPLDVIVFNSPQLTETYGGQSATLGNFKTPLGIASGIAGQGGLATSNTVGTGQIDPNSVSVPGYMVIDYGGSMGSFPQNTWVDFDTAVGGGSVGGGGGGGSGGGGGGGYYENMPEP